MTKSCGWALIIYYKDSLFFINSRESSEGSRQPLKRLNCEKGFPCIFHACGVQLQTNPKLLSFPP